MKISKNTVKLLATLLPAGVMGVSAALASTSPSDLNTAASKANEGGVASRLAAIRDAVSTAATEERAKDENVKTAWWANWHGGGIHFGGWRNGGWHNWGNGGWHNWGNGWHNWGNGWHNWGNW